MTLQPSTAGFYRAAGFEFAGSWNLYEVACEHVPRLDRSYRARRLPVDELGPIMKLYEQITLTRHGAFAREERWWRGTVTRPRLHETKETANLLLETADRPVAWAMLAFGTNTGPSGEPLALRVRVQGWGWLPGHDLAALGALAGYRTLDGLVRWSGPDRTRSCSRTSRSGSARGATGCSGWSTCPAPSAHGRPPPAPPGG